jgi:bacillithiol synthase
MEPACIRHTDLPGTTRLFADFTYHFDRVAKFYRYNPHDPASLEQAAREIDYPDDRRAALVAALRAQNGNSDSLDRLAQPGTVAVVTGQQVGLFSGPAYTIYKAITAARIARELNDRGIPAVPVFWLATEDHDFEEVNHTWVFDAAHQPTILRAAAPNENGRQRPVGNIAIDSPPVDALASALASYPFADEVIAAVRDAYAPGTTMGAAFRKLLTTLLQKLDLIFLDPLDPAIRKIGAPLVAEALSAAGELKARLLERNRDLEAAGYHAQVHLDAKTSLFFLLENGERIPLRRANSDYSDLRERAAEISPNALLRPVMQDYLLPTVAYIGGPAELAYLAQSQVLYDRLLGRMPVVTSRSSFTLVEPRAEKLLNRYRLTVPDIFTHEEGLKERVARALISESLAPVFDETIDGMCKNIDHLQHEMRRFDRSLAASLDGLRRKMVWNVQNTRRKVEREMMRRDHRAAEDARYLSNLVFPHRHPQERFYSILPFLAKHGPDLIDLAYDAARLDCPDHRVLII